MRLPSSISWRKLYQRVDVAAHVAHGGDSVSNEKRKNEFAAAGGFAGTGEMHVHVSEAGNKKFSGSVDDFRAARDVKQTRTGRRR